MEIDGFRVIVGVGTELAPDQRDAPNTLCVEFEPSIPVITYVTN